ncbi:MAG: SMI1/KNR4 family protein [Planctomycetota bacterium]|nr:SMI1/KNR4 family protein [Planctomycetota bacterium]
MKRKPTTPGYVHSLREIEEFEARLRISLPIDYKEYLLSHKTGSDWPVSILSDWCQPEDEDRLPVNFLEVPFPYTNRWNELDLFDGSKGWACDYFSMRHVTGSIRISNLGCERYALLIITGQERGKIWHDDRVFSRKGIYPLVSPGGRHIDFAKYISLKPGERDVAASYIYKRTPHRGRGK